MNALLIIDVQYDFLPGGALEVKNGDEVIPVINDVAGKFDLVIATQDWHPANHGSFASNQPNGTPFETIQWHGSDQVLWPDHCVQGSRGAEISAELNTNVVEAIFRKGMDPEIDSYSGFFDNHHEKATGLADYLRGRGVTNVFVAGLAADFCVHFTLLDAVREGFTTTLIKDATRPIDPDGFENNLRNYSTQKISVCHSTDISLV